MKNIRGGFVEVSMILLKSIVRNGERWALLIESHKRIWAGSWMGEDIFFFYLRTLHTYRQK